jgi:spoIIIJ-associated protein
MTTNGRVEVEEPEEDPRELLRELLEEVVEALGLDAEVQVEEVDGVLQGRMEGEEVGLLIGRRGQTIDAIQHLAQRIVFKGPSTRGASTPRVTIDAGGYRERREEALRGVALDAAEDALATGEPIELDPMPAAERRIVHEFLRDREDVTTHSEGEEPERYLVVEPVGA